MFGSERDGDWPPVELEPYAWTSNVDLAGLPKSVRIRARLANYEATRTPKIAERTPVLSPALSTLVTEASVEIARFDAELGREIAPFSAVLLRSESAASSKIENLTASARAIADAELSGSGRTNAALIVANTRAMATAIALSNRLDKAAILAMHAALLQESDPEIAGRWRTQQVWIGGSDFSPAGATFVAPHQDRVEPAMEDLVEFMRRDDLPALAQAAIAHAQFETIHPFPDGNGRTGRALIHAILRSKDLTRNVSVPISAGLLSNTTAYFDSLTAYRMGDVEAIIERTCLASYSAIVNGRQLVDDLRQIRDSWNDRITARRDASSWRLADLLVRQPVVDSAAVERELQITDTNALIALKNLEESGVLTSYSLNKKARAWRSIEVLKALEEFARRSGNRGSPG